MREAKNLVKSKERPSLPVSIPIHVYHNVIKKQHKEIKSKPIIMSSNISMEQQTNKKQSEATKKSSAAEVTINSVPERSATERQPPEFIAECNRKCYCGYCNNSSSVADRYGFCQSCNFIKKFINYFLPPKCRNEKSTQTDDIITFEDLCQTRAGGDIFKDIAAYSQQFKSFFSQLYNTCQVLFKEKTKDNRQILVYSLKKRQLFMTFMQSLLEALTCEETDTPTLENEPIYTTDLGEFVKIVNEAQKSKENTVPPKPTEAVRQDVQQNQTQKNTLNNVGVPLRNNVEITPRQDIVSREQSVTNPVMQKDLREKTRNSSPQHTILEEGLNQNISFTNDITVDQSSLNPQIQDNTRRVCSTPRSQAMQQQHYYQNQNYRNYQSKVYRHPNRSNGRPSPYPQPRTPIRNTERPPFTNATHAAQMYYPYNQPNLQQQFMLQQYYQRNPDARQNNYTNQY